MQQSQNLEVEIEKSIEQEAECILLESIIEFNLNKIIEEIDFTKPEYWQNIKEFTDPAIQQKQQNIIQTYQQFQQNLNELKNIQESLLFSLKNILSIKEAVQDKINQLKRNLPDFEDFKAKMEQSKESAILYCLIQYILNHVQDQKFMSKLLNCQNKKRRQQTEVDNQIDSFKEDIWNDEEKLNKFFYEIFYPRFQFMLSQGENIKAVLKNMSDSEYFQDSQKVQNLNFMKQNCQNDLVVFQVEYDRKKDLEQSEEEDKIQEVQEQFLCLHCNKPHKSQRLLSLHLKSCGKQKKFNQTELKKEQKSKFENQIEDNHPEKMTCGYCNYIGRSRRSLNIHYSQCEVYAQFKTKNKHQLVDESQNEIEQFKCDQCGNSFMSQKGLKYHQNRFCIQSVSDQKLQKSQLKQSIIEVLSQQEAKFKCEFCEYEAKTEKGLQIHRGRCKNIKCQNCGQKFNKIQNLLYHQENCGQQPDEDVQMNCDEEVESQKNKKEFTCKFCGIQLSGKFSHREHQSQCAQNDQNNSNE